MLGPIPVVVPAVLDVVSVVRSFPIPTLSPLTVSIPRPTSLPGLVSVAVPVLVSAPAIVAVPVPSDVIEASSFTCSSGAGM